MNILKNFDDIRPAFDKNMVVLKSTNIIEDRYQYVVDLRIGYTIDNCQSITQSTVAKLRVPPDPKGLGIIEVNNVLKDYVDYDLDFDMTYKDICETRQSKNWLIYGTLNNEAYVSEWIANDFIFVTPSNPGLSQLCLTTDGFSNVQHTYSSGDLIQIDSPNQSFVKSGIWRITEIVDTKTIRLNQFWQQPGAAFNITTKYADGRRTDFTTGSESGIKLVFNGSLENEELFYYNDKKFRINNFGGELITGLPKYKCLNCGAGYQNFTDDFDRIYWFSTDNDFFGAQYVFDDEEAVLNIETESSYFTFSLTDYVHVGSVGFGTGNLKSWGITPPDEDYLVWLSSLSEPCSKSDKILFKKKKLDCSNDTIKITFYDDLGGWSTINFNKNFSERIQIKKEIFNTELYEDFDESSGEFCGDFRRSSDKITAVDRLRTFSISTDFLEDEEVRYLKQLYTSRKVFWMKPDSIGRYYPTPINLINNDWTIDSVLIHRFRTATIQFNLANDLYFNK